MRLFKRYAPSFRQYPIAARPDTTWIHSEILGNYHSVLCASRKEYGKRWQLRVRETWVNASELVAEPSGQ